MKKIAVRDLIEFFGVREFNCRMTIEQRINIKLCVKLGKTATETLKMLRDVYGDSSMSRTRVFEWHKRFVEGREDVEDDPKLKRPCTSPTDTNIEKVRQLVCSDRRLTIRVIANELGMDKETVRTISIDTLGMRKVCAKMVSRLLTEEQKAQRLNARRDILQQMEADEKLLENVITGDKSWVFQYDRERKRQSRQWKSVSSPRPKKSLIQRSQVKVMLITFFDHQEMVHHEFVPQGQTVNQHFYKEVLARLVNKIRQKRRASWTGKTWILHHNNAPAHTALSVKQFLVSKEITTLHHPPYSPDLAPCDFFLFPELKGILKGTRFQGVEDIKTSMTSHSKPSQKKNFHSASKRGEKEWKSASKPMGNISKETSRDDLRLVCVRQCGHCMICI